MHPPRQKQRTSKAVNNGIRTVSLAALSSDRMILRQDSANAGTEGGLVCQPSPSGFYRAWSLRLQRCDAAPATGFADDQVEWPASRNS